MKAFKKKWDAGVWDIPYETDEVFAARLWRAAMEFIQGDQTADAGELYYNISQELGEN